jgi:hypothetical protein
MELYLDGVQSLGPDDGIEQYWSPIEKAPFGEYGQYCIGHPDHLWGSSWRYSLGTLPLGEHELYSILWLEHPITDVADYDGDGIVDVFRGSFGERTKIINVIPPP